MESNGGRTNFSVVRRGYEPTEVDQYVAALQAEVDDLRRRGTQVEEPDPDAAPRSIEALGDRVGQILELAWDSAEELRNRAAAEAEQHLSEATVATKAAEERAGSLLRRAEARMTESTAEAARIVDEAKKVAVVTLAAGERDAQNQAQALLVEAKATAERLVTEATAEAERTLAESRATAERTVVEALAESDRTLAESRRAREIADAELAEVRDIRQRVANDLAATLAGLQGAVGAGARTGAGESAQATPGVTA